MSLPGKWVDRIHERKSMKRIILDMDSSESPTYGNQQGTAYNGYFECTCYHPLFVFNHQGDLENTMLRQGNLHSAEYWRRVLLPVIDRCRKKDLPKYFRGDAAFAIPELMRRLEDEEYEYVIRIKSNANLVKQISHLLTRPVGRPSFVPKVFYHTFRYQAKSWEHERRIVAKVQWHAGELFPRIGFIVTNMNGWSKKIVRFYNKRATAEQWIKEGKHAIQWTRLSCHDFKDNQVRLQLFALAYNLGNFLRRLVLPHPVKHWFLTSIREKLIKI